MKCHYEVLEIPQKATDDEIKKAYRKLALKWHPDKNPDKPDVAKEQFQLVQQAYEVLSDPHERAWYDNHREQILRGRGEDYKDNSIDLFKFFSTSCFKNYEDDSKGFYTVYRTVFETIAAEDAEFSVEGDSDIEVPSFGYSNSPYEDVHNFYSYWQSYSTKRTYTWLDPHDTRDAPNRYVLRQMEKENKKIRDKAKKERNEQVRNLVAFVRKRDKRVQAHARMLEEKAKENKKKSEELKRQKLLERQKELKEYKESEWSKFSNIQSELKNIEASLAAQFGEELSSDEDNKGSDVEDSNALYCVACTKIFKTQKAFSNHENSKKHKDNVAMMRASMIQDDAKFPSSENEEDDIDSEDTDVKDSLPPGTKLATGPEMPDFLLNPATNNDDNVKTSDEERISNSDSDSISKKNKQGKSKKNKIENPLGEGYILSKSNEKDQEDGYDSDTPDEELISDQEDEIVLKSKKQKKRKNKNIQMPSFDDSEDEEKEMDLLMGLSKKQRKKQQQKKILMNSLSNVKKSNSDNINTDKDVENSASNSIEGNQGKADESDDDSQETVSPVPGKKKGKKAKELRKAQRQAAGEARQTNDRTRKASKIADDNLDLEHVCATCKQQFSSKNKLFDHLKKTGHTVYIPNAIKVKKNIDRTVKRKEKSNKNSD